MTLLKLSVAAGVLIVVTSAPTHAQTHPCDTTTPTTGTVAAQTTVRMEFCQQQAANIDAITVYRNGVPTQLTTFETVTPTPNAAGQVLYRFVLGAFSAGTHQIELTNWNKDNITGAAQEGPRSLPFTLTAVTKLPAPGAPKILRVTP